MNETNERSVASTGSVDAPAAWGVLRVGGGWAAILANEVQAETSRKSWDARENWVHAVVPLYRSPTLTDAEREVIRTVMNVYGEQNDDPDCEQIEATLWRLLERTK